MFKRKRSDTRLGTIEDKYGVSFGRHRDMKLGDYLAETGFNSMTEAVRAARAQQSEYIEFSSEEHYEDYERRVCLTLAMPHIGGSGAPDCADGEYVVDAKAHRRPLTASAVRAFAKKVWAQDSERVLVSRSGFTSGAAALARELGVILRHIK